MPITFYAECLDCGHKAQYDIKSPACPKCGSEWREARYNYAALAQTLQKLVSNRPNDLWRYRELLPIQQVNRDLFMGEGGTPLIHARNLGMMLGLPNLYIKDERQGPTTSFKDRQAAVTIACLKEAGITEMVCASTGNVAISYSAYAARAGIKLWAFLTSLVPAIKMREVAIYGTQVVKITGSYDLTKRLADQFSKQRGIFKDLGARSIPCVESMKTIAFEIAEQVGALAGENGDSANPNQTWQSPDWYIQSVSGAMGPLGVFKGFRELRLMGLIKKTPKLGLIQVEGCAPMVHAWRQNKDQAVPVLSPRTRIETLATGDPGRTYTLLRKSMLTDGGEFESVTDEEAFRSMHLLAKMEGISVEPAAAVAFAGMVKLFRAGKIKPNETVVINCTGHTVPVERSLLGEGWEHSIETSTEETGEEQEEGLLAALANVTMDRFPKVAIVDDEPDVRKLIRRILQSQGNYTLVEASNGKDAIDMILKERPNLILLDLMMPDLDGFSVMDTLQAKPETREIPIIVITAKELTAKEKGRLKGRIQSLMQKGNFMSDDLLDEVRSLLK
ncbi:MAG: pyridoxal-phosphate dependent enzyme [Anaerolineaceae bacterium]